MRVFRGLERARGSFCRPVLTIGNFDGVHRGHQVILDQVRADADHHGTDAVALTFFPHPLQVLRPDNAPRQLMTLGDRLRALANCGMDAVVVQRFSPAFADIEAEVFVRDLLVGALDVHKLVVGHDINFGKGRSGSAETLLEAGESCGFSVEVIQPVAVGGEVVHSSVVRRAVADGDVARAAGLLGRPWTLRGRTVRGDGRGGELGFATANLLPATDLVPADGVYATRALLAGQTLDGVTSVGNKPTFDGSATVVESHLFEPQGELYDLPMGVQFIERLRGQVRFSSAEELQQQVARDIEDARRALAEAG
ncbi:MAG TPA: bifunctional riboflavin kinase/FAD synthetase [Deltaproteobacteria bacterium]|nr:bifunctional riboflavin kinase/FAD synthetase [Candidatus Binatota bacterium]HIL12849.1 bifunctional riboflavin kinase/FAD synthetase [Deltaproteobacteria bacterium]